MKKITDLTNEDAEVLAGILKYDIPDDDGVKGELIDTYDADISSLTLGEYLPIQLFFKWLAWLVNNEYDMKELILSLGIDLFIPAEPIPMINP